MNKVIEEQDKIKVKCGFFTPVYKEATSNIKMMEVVGEHVGDQEHIFDLGVNEIDFSKNVLVELLDENNEIAICFNFKLVMKELGVWSIITDFEGEYKDTIYVASFILGANFYHDIYGEERSNINITGYRKIRVYYTPTNKTTPFINYSV